MSEHKPTYVYSPADISGLGIMDVDMQQNRPPNLKTGLDMIDKNCSMMFGGKVIGIQASTSHAKSTLMLDWAKNFEEGLDDDEVIVFATWEDSVEMMAQRLFAKATCIPVSAMYSGKLDEATLEKLRDASVNVQAGKIWIVGHSEYSAGHVRLTMGNIQEAVEYITMLGKRVRVVFMDYLQRISFGDVDRSFGGNTERTSEVMNKVKDLAIHTRALVIIATQVDREILKKRDEKMPQLGDAMYSSNFEQSCDAIFSMYIPSKFYPEGHSIAPKGYNEIPYSVTIDMVMIELQKSKMDQVPVLMYSSVDYVTGKFSRWADVHTGQKPKPTTYKQGALDASN